jgi:glycine dehydrogenase subunit 1
MKAYLPHTFKDTDLMLEKLGLKNIEQLFDCVPDELKLKSALKLPAGLTEPELKKDFYNTGKKNNPASELENYLGAGIYQRYIPACVGQLLNRSEFYTAYTPYQPEMTQGMLQAIFEYQSCICSLTGLDASNAGLYDGAHALAEAVLVAKAHTGRNRAVVSDGVHPEYIKVLQSYTRYLDFEIVFAPLGSDGKTDLDVLKKNVDERTACVVVANPSFFGIIEEVERWGQIAHEQGALFIYVAEPVALSVLKSPGEAGADLACGEGQSLGIPFNFGGPGFGFLSCRDSLLRKMPGRICGVSSDKNGKKGFVLTLQAREQHIRREKASSNICTNQALMALAATIYISALGPLGLKQVALSGFNGASYLLKKLLTEIPKVKLVYSAQSFFEFVIELPFAARQVCRDLFKKDIVAGLPLDKYFPGRSNQLLVCVTEVRNKEELDRYVREMALVLGGEDV